MRSGRYKALDTAGFKTGNIDSRNCLQREKSCTLIVGHRLFQRYRSNPELTAWVLMSAYAGCGHRGTSHSRFRSRNILRIKEAQLK